ncbi:MAG: hypothetical protein J1F33_08345 [Clostridiales bacterium]|nr:hypothetical protein [Clostridiales bacterium]
MRVYNSDKTEELTEFDATKGRLIPDTVTVHVAKREYVPEKFHYETVKEYHNGGKDVVKVVDEPGVEGVREHDEIEDIFVYVPFSDDELAFFEKEREISALKTELCKIKEDIEQESFGIVREDYANKKARAAEIVNKLRVIEGKSPREIR